MHSHLRVLVIIICLSNIQFAAFQNIPDPEEINSKEFLLSDLKEDEVFDYQSIGNLKKNAGNSLSTLITIQMSSANLTDIIKSIAR